MPNPAVSLRNVRLSYGTFVAVDDVSLDIEKSSFVTLLGPSGCGKTTILRAIAGLVHPTGGEIIVAGRRINDVPIHQRNIGLVFQNYALFPHKTVFDNIAFGLKYRDVPKADIAPRVEKALAMVRLPGVGRKYPSQLSGGQQQRIALARAIVIEPDVLLLDEPLSALDANLREEMRTELKTIQRDVGITTIFVTHDQEEALAMSNRIVVMNHGKVEQVGSPEAVYRTPQTRFVASFLGQSNILDGVMTTGRRGAMVELASGKAFAVDGADDIAPGSQVSIVVRAQKITVGGKPARGVNSLDGRVVSTSYLGGTATYVIDAGGLTLLATNAIDDRVYREGDAVTVTIAPRDCVLLDAYGQRIGP
jgi:spermidine/putrescine ABC transporter ATP-binding subunit